MAKEVKLPAKTFKGKDGRFTRTIIYARASKPEA
jgi:hypothetical protein